MDDLVTWLRGCYDREEQRLAEVERVALAASLGPWTVAPADGGTATIGHAGPISPTPWVVHPDEYGDGIRRVDAEHIARHDPARVLAEVDRRRRDIAGKRALITWIVQVHDGAVEADWFGVDAEEALRLLAQEFDGEPGWREEWRA